MRRALTLAIDRKTIVETLLGTYGKVADSPILTSVWAHDPALHPLPYDPAEDGFVLSKAQIDQSITREAHWEDSRIAHRVHYDAEEYRACRAA